ncbi:MAG TPA: hypothetical protein VLD83_05880 [Candidatus Binatia bacterium]|nr:hypothetical protein [Candidatus Binatia bacterium]
MTTEKHQAVGSSKPLTPARVWIWRAILALYLVYLVWRAWQARNAPFVQIDWAFQSSDELIAWLRGLARREVILFGLSFVLGLLTPPAHRPARAAGNHPRRWLVWLGWCGFGLATIALCFAIAWNAVPPFGSLLLPFLFYLVGLRLSSAALRGPRPFAWAAGQLGVLLLLLLATAAAMAGKALSTAPMDFEISGMGMAAKRQLAQRLRDTRPLEGQPRHLHLTDAEINALVNSALGRGGGQRRASVHFEPAKFTALASLALPRRLGEGQFLNVQLAGHLLIDDGRLHLGMDELRLGSLSVPAMLLRLLSSSAYAMLMDDPQMRRIIEAVDALNTEPGTINFVFQSGALSRQVVPALVQLLWERPDVAFETELYLRHLIVTYERLPAGADRFGLLLQAAFTMAAERSKVHDPLLENRAAIFALAILLGHLDLELFVGELLDPELRARAKRAIGTVPVRGRKDWTRHFWVSAALVLLSNEATSDRIGRLKEQLDAEDGGSGFSFADMLANAAGTRFAVAAMRDQSSARAMQERLARGFDLDVFFPPADDLPEDIPAAEFESRYGGVGGPGYRAIVDEINRRLDALPKV